MLRDLPTAIDGARIQAFCLKAPPAEIEARLRNRERGGLAESIFIKDIEADLRVYDILQAELTPVDTVGRTAVEVATEILERSRWDGNPRG
jgi:hypothetical protein